MHNGAVTLAGALGADVESAPTAWPEGCLGYAFNLVRPKRAGHRACLLYNMLGHTIVFRTLAEASAYRLDLAKVTRPEPRQLWLILMYTC